MMQNFLKREIGILINFLNIFGAEDRQKHDIGTKISIDFLSTAISHWKFFANGTEKYASFEPILHIKSPGSSISFNRKRPAVLK